ncbi:MAG: hypothetical protein IKL30_02825, partial [Anaerotignum sp.]|nr:hypothetical protein [Anaerotignum sp.]
MKKFKKLLAGIMTLAMLVTMLPATVLAGETKVEYNGAEYATITEAVAKVNEDGVANAELIIYGEQIVNKGVWFDTATQVVIKGAAKDTAKIILKDDADRAGKYGNHSSKTEQPTGFSLENAASGSITISDLTIENQKTLGHHSNGAWRETYYTYAYANDVDYVNVDFIGGVTTSSGTNADFEKCNFTEDDSQWYCLYIDQEYSNADVTINIKECTFNP